MPNANDCPDPLTLALFAEGALAEPARSRLEAHAGRCEPCRAVLGQLGRVPAAGDEGSGALAGAIWANVRTEIAPTAPPVLRLRGRSARHAIWGAAAGLLLLVSAARLGGGSFAAHAARFVDAYGRPIDSATELDAQNVGQEMITLPDGSRLQLGRDSRVRVYPTGSGGERGVDLLEGGVTVQVVPGRKPFRIRGYSGEVCVLGTRLEVRSQPLPDEAAGEYGPSYGPLWKAASELLSVRVYTGRALLRNAKGEVLVRSQEQGVAVAGDCPEVAALR